jgi:hypothetical protein
MLGGVSLFVGMIQHIHRSLIKMVIRSNHVRAWYSVGNIQVLTERVCVLSKGPTRFTIVGVQPRRIYRHRVLLTSLPHPHPPPT